MENQNINCAISKVKNNHSNYIEMKTNESKNNININQSNENIKMDSKNNNSVRSKIEKNNLSTNYIMTQRKSILERNNKNKQNPS